jgi:hypothetical protein
MTPAQLEQKVIAAAEDWSAAVARYGHFIAEVERRAFLAALRELRERVPE